MQQRQPRLGDILDDYCPRERRVTNHAVVAMVGEEVKQTRCTTCDAEHDYGTPGYRPSKKKDGPGTPFQEVLAGIPRSRADARSSPGRRAGRPNRAGRHEQTSRAMRRRWPPTVRRPASATDQFIAA